jgi:hypothetical protein
MSSIACEMEPSDGTDITGDVITSLTFIVLLHVFVRGPLRCLEPSYSSSWGQSITPLSLAELTWINVGKENLNCLQNIFVNLESLDAEAAEMAPHLMRGGNRFFGKRSAQIRSQERDDDSKKNHPALA